MPKRNRHGGEWVGWHGWLLPNAVCAGAVVAVAGGLTIWNIRTSEAALEREAMSRLSAVADVFRTAEAASGSDAGGEAAGRPAFEALAEAVGASTPPIVVDRVPAGTAPPAFASGVAKLAVGLPGTGETVWLSTRRGHANIWSEASMPAGAAALALAVVAFVSMRTVRGTAALRRIGSALIDLRGGTVTPEALRIADRFGPAAVAWNEMLDRLVEGDRDASPSFPDRRDGASESGFIVPSTLDAMPTGLLSIDDEGRVQFCNGAAAALLGVPKPEVVGAPFGQLALLGELHETISGALGGAHARSTRDIDRPDGDGHGVIRAMVRSLRQADEATVLVMLEDVTQQRMSEAARNGFVAQATHELRTPLTNIRLSAEEAIDLGTEEPATVAKLLNVVNAEARRLERVVNDMLSVSEIEAATLSLNLDTVPMSRMFEEIERDYEAQAAELGTTLRFSVPTKFDPIRADRDKFGLAVHNVIGNALKYTPPGGTVEVEAEQDDHEVRVRVRDNGPGIAPEDHEKIFQKFYRTDTARGSAVAGSGLGLALARDVARLHGGDITVESEPGHGATFTVTIPRTQGEQLSRAA